jgi:D-alanyl-D-alanine carboxypeptidase
MFEYKQYLSKSGGLWLCLLLALLTVFYPTEAMARYAHIVFDAKTGKVLADDNQHAPRQPASLTKMMTVYLAFSEVQSGRMKWDQKLKVSKRASRQSPSKLGLNPGDTITLRNAVMALITRSANDMAVVIAESLAGNEANFAQRMTTTARKLGMSRTTFKNASGLPAKGQITSARDMGVLGQALIRDFPEQYKMFNTESFVFRGQSIHNHNRLLGNYPGLDGIKTGYIRASGFNLVASAERGNHRLISVVMGGRSAAWRDRRMQALLDQAFAQIGVGRAYAAYPVQTKPQPTRSDQESAARQQIAEAEDEDVAENATSAITASEEGEAAKLPPALGGNQNIAAAAPLEPTSSSGAANTAALSISPAPSAPDEMRQAEAEMAVDENVGWSVQVGAFRNKKLAESAALRAKRAARDLRSSDVQISEIANHKKRLFRARLTGLDEPKANAACRTLKRQKFDCKIIRPTSSTS